MPGDEQLKQAIDYSEGQKIAAYMVLGEIVNLLNEFSDNIITSAVKCRNI